MLSPGALHTPSTLLQLRDPWLMPLQRSSPRRSTPPACPPCRRHDADRFQCTLLASACENTLGTRMKWPGVFFPSSRASLSSSAAFRHFHRPHSPVIPAQTDYALRAIHLRRTFTQGWTRNSQAEARGGCHNLLFGAHQMAPHNPARLAQLR